MNLAQRIHGRDEKQKEATGSASGGESGLIVTALQPANRHPEGGIHNIRCLCPACPGEMTQGLTCHPEQRDRSAVPGCSDDGPERGGKGERERIQRMSPEWGGTRMSDWVRLRKGRTLLEHHPNVIREPLDHEVMVLVGDINQAINHQNPAWRKKDTRGKEGKQL